MESAVVVMDTNFLLVPHQFRINVMAQLGRLLDSYSIVISTATIKELGQLAAGRGKAGVAARVAKKMLEANKGRIEIKETKLRADDFIEAYVKENAKSRRVAVCTNDIALRNRVRRLGAKVICVRSKAGIGIA